MPDIELASSTVVSDRLLQAGKRTPDLDWWTKTSKELGAGRMLMLSVRSRGDSVELVVEVYDVGRGAQVNAVSAELGSGQEDVRPTVARVVEQLFGIRRGTLSVSGSAVVAAVRAYVAGRMALDSWNLRLAEERFREAIDLDREFALAHLWLAQVKSWAGDDVASWEGPSRTALQRSEQLPGEVTRGQGRALLALAEGRFAQACDEYARLIAMDSSSFEGWFGLGECRRLDRVVVRDGMSPTGWRFRSGYQGAMAAYQRALQSTPSFNFVAFTRLPQVLYVEPAHLRDGRPAPPDTGYFLAYASQADDTIAFVPGPAPDVLAGRTGLVPSTLNRAIAQNRGVLLSIVRSWARAFPDSSWPNRELARALELGNQVDRSALAAARAADRTARTAADSARARIVEVRLLVKLDRWRDAALLAAESLRRWPDPEPELAHHLAALAALIGQVDRTARLWSSAGPLLLSHPGGIVRDYGPGVLQAWKFLEGYAAFGSPTDSLLVLSQRLEAMLPAAENPGQVYDRECRIRGPILVLTFPELRRVSDQMSCWPGNAVLEMEYALSRGDTARVRARFADLRDIRRGAFTPPGDLALGGVYHEAWLLLQVQDTAAAIELLDQVLAARRSLRTDVLEEPAQAAGLVRAMALRAELAATRGDRAVARRWADAVIALWGDADQDLQPLVGRIRALSSP